MIKSISLSSFKIYRGHHHIETSDSKFIAIVGRNGSGKSALVDGIIWCAFERGKTKNKFLRVKNSIDLINKDDLNDGITYTEVAVEFINPKTYDIIIITKRLDINNSSKTIGTYIKYNENDDDGNENMIHVRGNDIDEILERKFDTNHENINRIVLTQNTTQMVNYSSLDLLNYIEKCCCTDKFANEIEQLQVALKNLTDEALETHERLEKSYQDYQELMPKASKVLSIKKQLHENESKLLNLLKKQLHQFTYLEFQDVEKKTLLCQNIDTCKLEIEEIKAAIASKNNSVNDLVRKQRVISNKVKKLSFCLEEVNNIILNTSANIKRRTKEIERDQRLRSSILGKIAASKTTIKSNKKKIDQLESQVKSKVKQETSLDESISLALNTIKPNERSGHHQSTIKRIRQLLGQRSCLINEEQIALSKTNDAINRKEQLYSKQLDLYNNNLENKKMFQTLNNQITELSATMQLQKLQVAAIQSKIEKTENDRILKSKYYDEMKQKMNKRQMSNTTNEFLKVCSKLIKTVKSELIESDEDGLVYGMLCDVIEPIDPKMHTLPIIEVLGSQLTHTLIVKNRKIALYVAKRCQQLNVTNLTIDIVDEIVPFDRKSMIQAMSNSHSIVPLTDCVRIKIENLDNTVSCALKNRLKTWCLYKGTITTASKLWSTDHNMNIVSLDGSRFFKDGEIRLNFNDKIDLKWSVCCGNTANENTTVEFNENDLQQLSTQIYALNSQLLILNHSLKETEALHSNSNMKIINLKGELKKVRQIDDRDVNTKPDDSSINADKEVRNSIIDSFQDAKNAVQHDITDLIGETIDSSKLISLLISQDEIHQELSNINIALNILRKEAENNSEYLRTDENKVNRIEKQIMKKKTDNNDDNMILLHNTEIFNMLNEDLLTNSIMLKSSSDGVHSLKTNRNTLNAKICKLQSTSKTLNDKLEALNRVVRCRSESKEQLTLVIREKTKYINEKNTDLPVFKEDDSDESQNGSEISDDDFEKLKKVKGSKRLRRKVKGLIASDDDMSNMSDMSCDEELEEEQLKYRSSQLLEQYRDHGKDKAIDEIYVIYNLLVSYKMNISKLKQQSLTTQNSINQLQNLRFSKDKDFLDEVNKKLTAVVNALLPDSDCYLSHGDKPLSLFREGLTLLSKQRNGYYRELKNLSGGQQSIFCLSLSIAIQQIFPSPFWIMDEIDAALDIIVVSNLAKLLYSTARETYTQFIVVTHRPEMYSCAETLLGIFLCGDKPCHLTFNNREPYFVDEEEKNGYDDEHI